MPWTVAAAAIAAYGAYAASEKSSEGAKQAAEIQAKAQREATQTEQGALEWQRKIWEDIKPYVFESLQGYEGLLKRPEEYKKAPGYAFRLQEGLKTIGIPEGGRGLSGSQIKAAIKYSQDYATSEYNQALARMAGLGEVAQGAGGTALAFSGENILANIANMQYGGGIARGGYAQNAANARAAGYIGMSRAIAGGVSSYGAANSTTQGNTSYYNYNQNYGGGYGNDTGMSWGQ